MCPCGRPRGQGRPRGLHLWYLIRYTLIEFKNTLKFVEHERLSCLSSSK